MTLGAGQSLIVIMTNYHYYFCNNLLLAHTELINIVRLAYT